MTIYQALQLNAAGSKNLLKQAKSREEKMKWTLVYGLKILLTVMFCFLFVTIAALWWGNENSIVGVVILLSLLTLRQADFGIRTSHGTGVVLIIFGILLVGPRLFNTLGPWGGLLVNLVCLTGIMIFGCHHVVMSNQFTFVLGYLLLQGYDVEGPAWKIRSAAIIGGGLLCAGIFAWKHRDQHYRRTIVDIFREFDLRSTRTEWQLKLAVGISLAMFLADLCQIPRSMWVGICAMSMLAPFFEDTLYRAKRRAPFTFLGCILFIILYYTIPESAFGYIGILGGIGVGLSATYGWQTVFNVLGALSVAINMFGLVGAIILRVGLNVITTFYVLLYSKACSLIRKRVFC